MHNIHDLFAQAPEKVYRGIQTQSHYLTMHDGTQIAVDVLLPLGLAAGVRLPVVLTMTRYWRSFELRIPEPPKRAPIAPREPLADDLVLRGFAMIMVDARGSGASTEISRCPWAAEEIADYGEVVEWALAQPWCNGKVGAVGISYEGTTALLLSTIGDMVKGVVPQQSPYLKPKSKPNPTQAEQWDAIGQFFAQTLKNDQIPQQKTLFYYTLGAETWQKTHTFPLPNTTMQRWYFHAEHHLLTQAPNAEVGADTYQVDFNATTGTNNRWHTQLTNPLIYANRAKADRRLLTYTSPPLQRDMEITGYPIVTLYLSSTAEDGAFFVYLEDVAPSGIVHYITEGMLRGIHRHLSDETPPYVTSNPYRTFKRADAMPLPRKEIVELTFPLFPTSVLLRRGHRIRVAISGADKDTFARIPAQGTPTLEISRNRKFASSICLPVVDNIAQNND